MKKVGIFEAKTRLSELCIQVEEAGMEFVITRRGKPVARLVGTDSAEAECPYLQMPITEALVKWNREGGHEAKTDFPEVWKSRKGFRPDPLQD